MEFLFPYDFDSNEIAERLKRFNLTQALFNMPPGNWAAGERGMAAIPGREDEFRKNLLTARDYALTLRHAAFFMRWPASPAISTARRARKPSSPTCATPPTLWPATTSRC